MEQTRGIRGRNGNLYRSSKALKLVWTPRLSSMKIKIKLDQTRGAMPTRPGEKTGAVTHRLQSFVNRRLRTILGPG